MSLVTDVAISTYLEKYNVYEDEEDTRRVTGLAV